MSDSSKAALDPVVNRLLAARDGGEPVPVDFMAAHPLTHDQGLEVQSRVLAAMGPIAAWKVSPNSTPEVPNYAPIPQRNAHRNSHRFPRKQFRGFTIECEIAYELARDLPQGPYTLEQIRDAVGAIVPFIEICDSRLADNKAASHGWRLADFANNGAAMLGNPIKDWRSLSTQDMPVTLSFDGKEVGGAPGNKRAELLEVVRTLANQVGSHCGGLKAGHVVTTGTITGAHVAQPGVKVVADYGPHGKIEFSLGE